MTKRAKIVGVTVLLRKKHIAWDVGENIKINHPGHKNHGVLGTIVDFQVVADPNWKDTESDDQGQVVALVALFKSTRRPTLYGVPFERLSKPSPLEQLACAKDARSSLRPSK